MNSSDDAMISRQGCGAPAGTSCSDASRDTHGNAHGPAAARSLARFLAARAARGDLAARDQRVHGLPPSVEDFNPEALRVGKSDIIVANQLRPRRPSSARRPSPGTNSSRGTVRALGSLGRAPALVTSVTTVSDRSLKNC